MNIARLKKSMLFSIFNFTVSSISFLLIPISNFHGTKLQLVFAYTVGVLFWSGLIVGLSVTILLGYKRKKDKFKVYKLPGIFNFFKNKKAKIFDVLMIFALIMFIIFSNLFGMYHNLSVLFLSLTWFFFCMHSVFNGNNYMYVSKKGVKE